MALFGRLLRVTGMVLVIAVAFVAPVLVTSTPASAATTPAQLNGEVNGSFSGLATLTTGSCVNGGFEQQVFDATYTTSTGTDSISVDGCATAESTTTPPQASFSGSFTLTASDGATVQGNAAGVELGNSNPVSQFTLSFTLTPTSGTNEFATVTGVVNLTGVLGAGLSGSVPVSGSLSGALNPGSGSPTTTSLSSSANPSALGQAVTYTATVSPTPTGGTVAFSDDGSLIPGCSAVPVSGASASCSVTPAGTPDFRNIVAVYGGSGVFLGSMAFFTQDVAAPPPTTSVLLPTNEDTVIGDSWLDAGASSPVGVASVNFEVSGGSLSSSQVVSGSTPTLYGWIGAWNSTSVPNGTYTIQSVATDTEGGSATSAPITVTVSNPPPSTSVLIPSTGATLSGTTAVLDATATADVTLLVFELSGGGTLTNIATATATPYGWLAEWNTTSVPNGTYTLQSAGLSSTSGTVTSAPITVTVSN